MSTDGQPRGGGACSPSKRQINAALGWLRGSLQTNRTLSPARRPLASPSSQGPRSGAGDGVAAATAAAVGGSLQAATTTTTCIRGAPSTARPYGGPPPPRRGLGRPYGGPPPPRQQGSRPYGGPPPPRRTAAAATTMPPSAAPGGSGSGGGGGGGGDGGGGGGVNIVDAAALQDHLRRSMKLNLGGPPGVGGTSSGAGRRRPTNLGRRAVASAPAKARVVTRWTMDGVNYGSGRSGGGGGGGGGVGGGGGGGGGGFARKRWKCLRCQHRNSSADEDCRVAKLAMGNQRGRFSAEDTDLTNAVIITGSSGSGGTTEYFLKCAHCDLLLRNARADAESVIGYEPKLSLAQRRGLVERPEPKLSDDQWDKIEEMTRRRGDHVRLCAICQQKFGASEQIILSCSHIFHRKCLLSFERFVKSRQRRCCPICRKANYQKRVSHAGFFDSRTEAARAFQRLFRGFRERVAHDARRRRLYQSGAKGAYDPALRRKYIFSSVQNVSTKLETAVARREGSVETALAMADKALAASRSFFRTLGVGGAAACSGSAGGSDAGAGATGAGADYGIGGTASAASTVDEEGFWRRIAHTTRARGDDDCAICLCELRGAGDNEEGDVGSSSGGGGGDDGSGGDRHQQPPRRLVLLNCSHVFHQPCLKAYENFNVYDVQLCPTCRAAYRKRVMPMHEFFAE